jgi:NAD(P)-dependent dehydrogenase (short-subunit alcohol dehydrogenase family)
MEQTMDRLKNKVAVITGGGAGIGRATCELFAEQGAAVVVAERDEVSGREVVDGIVRRGGRAHFIRTDVANESSIQGMASAVEQVFGRLDILVNNAAQPHPLPPQRRGEERTLSGVTETRNDSAHFYSTSLSEACCGENHSMAVTRSDSGRLETNSIVTSVTREKRRFLTLQR